MITEITTPELRLLGKLCRSAKCKDVESFLRSLVESYGSCAIQGALNSHRLGADETLLHIAVACNDDVGVTLSLLAYGALVDSRGFRSNGRAPLHEAARLGRHPQVRTLLDAGARVDARKSGDWTPLMLAAHNGHTRTVRTLLDAGARLDLVNSYGASSLYLAARSGSAPNVREILTIARRRGVLERNLVSRTRNGRTPLHGAVTSGSLSATTVLLAAGAPCAAVDSGGMSAAHEAAAYGHTRVLRALLAADSVYSAAQRDKGGYTALHHSAIGGHVECALLLHKLCGIQDKSGYCAAELATLNENFELAAMLIEKGDSVKGESFNFRSLRPTKLYLR